MWRHSKQWLLQSLFQQQQRRGRSSRLHRIGDSSSWLLTSSAAAMVLGTTTGGFCWMASVEEDDSNSEQQHNNKSSSTHYWHRHSSFTSVTTCEPHLQPHPQDVPSSSSSANHHKHNPRHRSRLARHRTILQMETTSSKASIESRYRVHWKKPLGEGAFGAVYIGTDADSGERVAIKQISKKHTDNVTFQREMDALIHIRKQGGHPNICGMRENFDQGPWYYIILDLVAGGEMFDHLVSEGPYSEADAARLVREVASALAFLHGIGVVHGDLKPENLMLSSSNSSEAVIKLVDFGTAQVLLPSDDDDNGNDNDNNGNGVDEDLYGHPLRNNNHHAPTVMTANTPAYSPPEVLRQKYRSSASSFLGPASSSKEAAAVAAAASNSSTAGNGSDTINSSLEPSFDMWAMGVIIYIMLTGVHPFDLSGNSPDEEVEHRIITHQAPPLHNSPITAHLSDSAKELIDKLMNWDPQKRLTANDMLNHPWVRGETARIGKMADSDKRLSTYRAFKSKLAAQVFSDLVSWSNEEEETEANLKGTNMNNNNNNNNNINDNKHNGNVFGGGDQIAKRTSLLERSFHKFDPAHKGYISTGDLRRLTKTNKGSTSAATASPQDDGSATSDVDAEEAKLSMTGFSDLLAENMKNRYWPKGHVVYREGDIGNAMFFINSGSVEVSTREGHTSVRRQGENFGEGALLHPKRIRSATVRCVTPVHAIEISREYFEKYIAEETGLKLNLREKDRTRKRQRAKTILRLQQNMKELAVNKGDYLFRAGEEGHELYILEEGKVDVYVEDHRVFSMQPGDICGEHSLIMGRPRNTSTKCVSENCKLHVMKDKDFYLLLDAMPAVRESLRDMCLRREFQKALVFRTKKEFPTKEQELKEAFDAADENHQGSINLSNVQHMLKEMDSTFSDHDIEEILLSLDLDDSGEVNFTEFQRIFSFEQPRRKTK